MYLKASAWLEKPQPHPNCIEQPNAWSALDVAHDVRQTRNMRVTEWCCGVPSSLLSLSLAMPALGLLPHANVSAEEL